MPRFQNANPEMKLPSLPPLQRGRFGYDKSDLAGGETGFGFSPVTAEINKARQMLADNTFADLSPTNQRGAGRSNLRLDRNKCRQIEQERKQELVNLTRMANNNARGLGSGQGNSLFGGSTSENIWRSKDSSLSAGRGDWQRDRGLRPLGLPSKKGAKKGGEAKKLRPGKKLKSIAKKRGKRRRKKMAARTIQRSWRGHIKKQKGIMSIQSLARGFVARRHVKRMKQAKEAGVMVAMKGTIQGKSGWYQDFDGQQYFFAVDPKGTWWQVMNEDQWFQKSEDLEGVPVLVCADGTKLGTPGKYREYGVKGAKKKPRKWKIQRDGIWLRK